MATTAIMLAVLALLALSRAEYAVDESRFMFAELSKTYPLPDPAKDPLRWFQHREWLYSLSDSLAQKAYLLEAGRAVADEKGQLEGRPVFDLRRTARERVVALLTSRIPNEAQRKACLDLLALLFSTGHTNTISLPYKQLIEVLLPVARLLIRNNAIFTAVLLHLDEDSQNGMVTVKEVRYVLREFVPARSLFGQALGDARFDADGHVFRHASKLGRRPANGRAPVLPPMPLLAYVPHTKKVVNGATFIPTGPHLAAFRKAAFGGTRVTGRQGGSRLAFRNR